MMARTLAFAAAAVATVRANYALSPDMQTVQQRLLQSYVLTFNVSGADADVAGYLPLLQPPGMFSDLNYTSGSATGWGGYDHCLRMSELGSVFYTNTSRYYQSSAVYDALLGPTGAFTWFMAAQPQDESNWWYQMIGCGRPVAQLSVQFQAKLSTEQVQNATSIMNRAQWISYTNTGTNAADIAIVHIGNGLLNNNQSYVAEAFAKIWSTMNYAYGPSPVSPEGPKPDGSFMQHGPQLYNGNYGASWTRDSLTSLSIATATVFNASGSAYDAVTHVTLDGCARMIHWPSLMWDPAVIGRQITNPGGQNVAGSGGDALLLSPQVLRAAGGPRAAELNELADAIENPAAVVMPSDFTPFPCTDYAVQRRPEYYASVRMISVKTAGGECINGQGLQSLHAADGAQYIMKTGHEYDNIAPTWNWEMLPGTTVQRGGTPLTCATADGNGEGPFAGAVTADNRTGVAYMDFDTTRYGQSLQARKAYFFLDGFLLSLGMSIRTVPGYRVSTTLDSRLLETAQGVVYSADGGKTFSTVQQGNHTYPGPAALSVPYSLFHHQDMGFAVLTTPSSASASVSLLNQNVTGNWSSIGTWPGPPITNPMFTLAIDHGEPPVSNASFAYAIWPSVDRATFTAGAFALALQRYSIWRNEGDVQAVYDSTNNTLYAVLYGGNTTKLALPPALRANWIVPSNPVGLVATTYVNSTTGATVLSISFADSGAILSAARPGDIGLGHTYPFYWYTGAAENGGAGFVPCQWPGCPGQWATPKGYQGVPPLKFNCYSNGTIYFENPPSQIDAGVGGTVPPINCAFA